MTYYGSGTPIPITSSGKTYEKCYTYKARSSYCGVEEYNTRYHYRPCDKLS